MSKYDEKIMVVRKDLLFENGKLEFQGLFADRSKLWRYMRNMDLYYEEMRRGHVSETDRPPEENAELNFDYKQLIPYAVLIKDDKIFTYERLSGGGESRLHGSLSIGVGGHMNKEPIVLTFEDHIINNIFRELSEELNIVTQYKLNPKIVGFINDEQDEVGKVHFGIVVLIVLPDDTKVSVKETDQLKGSWMTLDELMEKYDDLENWSKIVLDNFDQVWNV